MICKTCVNAGAQNSAGNYADAERLHADCEWPRDGCYCQHATGEKWRRGKYAAS